MSNYGQFVGTVKAEWLESGRKMKLLEDFIYIDPGNYKWKAPKDSIVDGASIPRLLWTVVGPPFAGRYRDASVVHDVACDQKSEPWKNVHRMFFYACLCGGVGEKKAKLMFWAVRSFGPRWGPEAEAASPKAPTSDADLRKQIEAMEQLIERENPSLERLEEFSEPY